MFSTILVFGAFFAATNARLIHSHHEIKSSDNIDLHGHEEIMSSENIDLHGHEEILSSDHLELHEHEHIEPEHIEHEHFDHEHFDHEHFDHEHFDHEHFDHEHFDHEHIEPEHIEHEHIEPEHYLHHDKSSAEHYEEIDKYAYPKYKFSYSVSDPHTGDYKTHHESRDGDAVHGYYNLAQPDGAVREVKYSSDGHSGFQASVHISNPSAHKSHEHSDHF